MSIPKPSSRVKSVLHDCTVVVSGSKHGEDDDGMPISETIEITMKITVLELNYGPCLDWTLTVDVPCEMGWIITRFFSVVHGNLRIMRILCQR
jgi:hypothetical protein